MKIILKTTIIFLIIFYLSFNLFSQSDNDTNDITKEEELNLLINNYEELVKKNANWTEKYNVVLEIKKFIDNNYHNAKAYDILVKWYFFDGLLNRVKHYGQKAIDVSNKLNKVYFTRDILYYMGRYYISKNSESLDYAKALGYFKIVNGMGKDEYVAKADLLYNIGICYYQLNGVRNHLTNNKYLYLAEASIEFAVFLEKDIEYQYKLGNIYEQLGKFEKALNIYEDALKINPSYKKALVAKENLEEILNQDNN